jgi:hypothetical protein
LPLSLSARSPSAIVTLIVAFLIVDRGRIGPYPLAVAVIP